MNSRSLDDVIVDPLTYATAGAYDALFNRLRREEPVHWTEPQGYRPFWTVSKYNDIVEIESQPAKFINEPRLSLHPWEQEKAVLAMTGGKPNATRMLVSMDGSDHTAHRRLAQGWFVPANLRKLEQGLAELAKDFVDRMEKMGGECDFVRDVGVWYPLRVIMMILGVPPEDDELMLDITKKLLGAYDPEFAKGLSPLEVRAQGYKAATEYFGKLAAERRKNPTDDLATVFANAKIDGNPINDLEMISYYLVIATAGHDTTSATVAGGLLALMQNPAQLGKLRANLNLLSGAIEEMLRWESPVKHFMRTATEDYVLRGQQIKAGQALMLCYQSANRDEEIFKHPSTFDIERSPNKHIAFGHGPHLCLGMNLARMEMKALYRELLSRLDHIELAGHPSWTESTLVCGLKHMPVRYQFTRAAA